MIRLYRYKLFTTIYTIIYSIINIYQNFAQFSTHALKEKNYPNSYLQNNGFLFTRTRIELNFDKS
jgi:hypothetical protein